MSRPTLGLALGGGGARGIAHIAVLEALDEAGVRPVAVVGTSIGAIVGAAYCAGLSGAALKARAQGAFQDRAAVMAKLFQARVGRVTDLLARRIANPVLLDAEALLDLFWPPGVPARFEDLPLPFVAMTCDYHARARLALSRGPLRPAVAASMAIPGLMRPVRVDVDGAPRVLIDGGAADPLPFEEALARADVVLAVDVTGGPPAEAEARGLGPFEAMFGASQIMQHVIVAEKLKSAGDRVRLVTPDVDRFRAADFFAARRVIAAAEPAKAQVRAALEEWGLG